MRLTWRSELAHIFAAATEAAWLSAVLVLLTFSAATSAAGLVGLPLFVLIYASRLLVRYLAHAQLDLTHSRTLLAYLVIGSLLIALKLINYSALPLLSTAWLGQLVSDLATASPAVPGLLLTTSALIFVWWRALRIVVEGTDPSYLFRQFQIGLLGIIVCAFLGGRVGLGGAFVPWIFWFFLWGLLAVAVTRLESMAQSRRSSVETYWLPILLAVTVAVLLGGGVVSLLYSHEFISAMSALLRPLGQAIEALYNAVVTIILVLVLPFAYIIDAIVRLIMSLMGPRQNQETVDMPTNPFDQLQEMQREAAGLPPELQAVLRWLIAGLALLVAVNLLQHMLGRRRTAAESDVEEIHESVFSLAEVWADIVALWRRLLARLRPGRQQASAPIVSLATAEERAAYSVRQVYQRLLALAASLGRPRPPASTPYEFLGDLRLLLPASQDDLSTITDLYVQARYGVPETGAGDVETAQQAWLRLQHAGVELKSEQARQRRAELGSRFLP